MTAGASRRAGLAAPPGLTVIVTTRPRRKNMAGVPDQEGLRHQPCLGTKVFDAAATTWRRTG